VSAEPGEANPERGGEAVRAPPGSAVARRDPTTVMRLARLGASHQSRLSFMRVLTRRMQRERWTFTRPAFAIDERGVGHALYSARTPERTYTLVAFAHDLPAEKRSDRVIAEAWDATFTLFDGSPTDNDIARLARNVPLQEGGRVGASELSLARANRSVRLWEHVVSSLAAGRQPVRERIDEVGYLMRTTAVYGSGKFGAADREVVADRPELAVPFQVEMLTVYLIRACVRDLVEHAARCRGGEASARLEPGIARSIGIGNSTGLGMAPFIVNHPVLFNNWIMVREEAIARVRGIERATPAELERFRELLARSALSAARWHSVHPLQAPRIAALRADLAAAVERTAEDFPLDGRPWDRLYRWAENALSVEGQECLAVLMLEPYGDTVDGLACCMASDDDGPARIDGSMTLAELTGMLEEVYGWALSLDWNARENCGRAWYVSAEKLEPRLGERFEEPIEPYEQPLAPARDAAALHATLARGSPDTPVAEFLLRHPEHRHTVRRLQVVGRAPYAEIRDNTIGAAVLPIDMLRAKLAFFGATRFDPRSDRWVRICMYGNAPYPEELGDADADTWVYPESEGAPV